MKSTLTIRNLPPDVAKVIRQRATKNKTSLNRAVLGILEELVPARAEGGKRHIYHDLDSLAGSWCAEEAAEFEKALGGQREVDEEMWK